MSCIISKYVYQFVSSEGKYLIYCFSSNSFLEVRPELSHFINECKINPARINELNDELLELLKENRIVVNADYDKNYLLEHQFNTDLSSYSNKKLGVILVPTISCNFDCPYCFENGKKAKTMTTEIINDLISFLSLHQKAKSMNLMWYGGEPLLAFKKIKQILYRIKEEVPIEINEHNIITNGYYFTSEVIDFFKEFPLDVIQITLDGRKERHNDIRKQKRTGKETYDRIIENIDNILKELTNTQVHVRINIDKTNIEDFIDGQRVLGERWKDKNVIIYPGILRIDNDSGTALACSSMNKWETAEFLYDLNEKGIFKTNMYPQMSYSKNCCATKVNSYIIGPRGEIYKCWNDVSDENKIVGYINQEKFTNPSLLYSYIVGTKWYQNPNCKECTFLPICNGNCSWYALKNLHQKGEYILCDCLQKAPEMLNKCLEYYYKNRNKVKP